MSENLAHDHHPDAALEKLYTRWAHGGAALLITGNIMIDRRALGEPNNVVVEKGYPCPGLKDWAKQGTANQTELWGQINHPGKQSPKFLSLKPVAPSAIELKAPLNKFFNRPRALEEPEILELIERYATTARMLKEAGFTGVQVHGAHGYLVSQFLSAWHNQRTDRWGGSLDRRMRFAVEVVQAIRQAVGPSFPVGIKLNSADFQRGGFSREESMETARILSSLGMDLIEISGGNYEAPAMTGVNRKQSTMEREAYFLEYCEEVRKTVKTPLMLTGGFRTAQAMNTALSHGACDMIGLARALALNPVFPKQLLSDSDAQSEVRPLTTGWKAIDRLFPLEITWYTQQLHRMGKGKDPKLDLSVKCSALSTALDIGLQGLRKVRG